MRWSYKAGREENGRKRKRSRSCDFVGLRRPSDSGFRIPLVTAEVTVEAGQAYPPRFY